MISYKCYANNIVISDVTITFITISPRLIKNIGKNPWPTMPSILLLFIATNRRSKIFINIYILLFLYYIYLCVIFKIAVLGTNHSHTASPKALYEYPQLKYDVK